MFKFLLKMPVHCQLCSKKLICIRALMEHYVDSHSKYKIVRQLILNSVINKRRQYKHKTNILRTTNPSSNSIKKFKTAETETETLYLNDSIHILCGRNDIIIGDGKNTVGLGFPFKKSTSPNENLVEKVVKDERTTRYSYRHHKKSNYRKPSTSSTTSSEEFLKKKYFTRKPKSNCNRGCQYYRIDISKLSGYKSLNEKTGEFYICSCREKYIKSSSIMKKTDLKILTSDTESASSDTGRSSVFCLKCGNGYKNTLALKDHMKIHERHCRVCNEIFSNEELFKAHIQDHLIKVYACHYRSCAVEFPFKEMLHKHLDSHVESEVLDSVLDMEEDYNIEGYNKFENSSYQESINSILGFLRDFSHFSNYSNGNIQTVVCDICSQESLMCDYESHLRNVHYVYSFQGGQPIT